MNNSLLQRYVTDRSEAAFTELVRQHIDLVYSAALRQVNGDAAAAHDVTQAVFTELARKAPRLVRHPSLTGWLYTSTRFVCAKTRRTEQRRAAREQEAYAMNQLYQASEPDPSWAELRPVLDEAMHELSADDREAVLLRFFEGRPIAEIGAKLGLTEDTARKRVARALDKLRERLARRGITSTVAALSAALAERTVVAAPTGMAVEISRAAAMESTAGSGAMAMLWKMLLASGAVAVIAVAVAWPRISHSTNTAVPAAPATQIARVSDVPVSPAEAVKASVPAIPAPSTSVATNGNNQLLLHIVTADSGKPVPSVKLDYWLYTTNNVWHEKPLTASLQGDCVVPVNRATNTELILVSERDGFADTRLEWHLDRGDVVPQEYTLRLTRAISLGGTVLDVNGNPVAGAEVGFNNDVDPASDLAIESHNFGWPYWIDTKTDAHGQWQINRVSQDSLLTLRGDINDKLHVGTGFDLQNAEVQAQLLAGNYEARLGSALEVNGSVVDGNGQPVRNARVTVGYYGMTGSREARSNAKGKFHVAGCEPQKTVVTAEAKGFAPTTIKVNLTTNTGPYQLVLHPGKLLRLRVVDPSGAPVARANVWFNTYPSGMESDDAPPKLQTSVSPVTKADGTATWQDAPDQELTFDVVATGFVRQSQIKVTPDGQEHVVTLIPGLEISGTVNDAATGRPIPSFKMVAGYPSTNPVTHEVVNHWSSIDRFWANYTGGKFHRVWTEAVLGGKWVPPFVFKITADGYQPFVTRVVDTSERRAEFDIALQPSVTTTVRVSLPDGTPAAAVEVGLVSAGAGLSLIPGGFSLVNRQSGGAIVLTDRTGQFSLNADDEIKKVVAASPNGYAEKTRSELVADPTLVLQPWGRLEGTMMVQGNVATNSTVAIHLGDKDETGISTGFSEYQTKTDAVGHFVFPQAPPGAHRLVEVVEINAFPSPNGKAWTTQPLTNVVINPGATTTITVSGAGQFVAGNLLIHRASQ